MVRKEINYRPQSLRFLAFLAPLRLNDFWFQCSVGIYISPQGREVRNGSQGNKLQATNSLRYLAFLAPLRWIGLETLLIFTVMTRDCKPISPCAPLRPLRLCGEKAFCNLM
jgi:hypothetical protein